MSKSTKDISDIQVIKAYVSALDICRQGITIYPEEILMKETGAHENVCFSAMIRACKRGLIDYGVSVRSGWVTEHGRKLLGL